jgi:hypothetical protein
MKFRPYRPQIFFIGQNVRISRHLRENAKQELQEYTFFSKNRLANRPVICIRPPTPRRRGIPW